MQDKMRVGISTASLYPLETEKALRELAIRGIKTVEIFFNANCELTGDIFKEICNIVDEYAIDVASVHPFTCPIEPLMLFSRYERRVDEMLDYYKRYFNAMGELGAEIFVLHGAFKNGNCTIERYIERYQRLFQLGREFGITVAQENVEYCMSGKVDLLHEMSEQLGSEVAFVLDIKQAVRSGISPFELVDKFGSKIRHIHISDNDEEHDCMLISSGSFDFRLLINRLKAIDYHGALILELYRNNYSTYDELAVNIQSVEKLI